MRSEERAGIVSIIMLFLWGTLIAEPFHIFARYISAGVTYAMKGLGVNDIVTSIVLYLIIVAVIVLMQKLSKTKISEYIPCAVTTLFIAMLTVKSIVESKVNFGDAICLAIPAVLGLVFYFFKFEKGLKWFTDAYTYSLGIALLNSLVFVPIARLNSVLSKILYITRYNDLSITNSLSGLAGIHEIIWGLFFAAFAVFPIIYLATSSRRK